MKVCMIGAATLYTDSVPPLAQPPGRSQGFYPVFPEHPAPAAA